MGLKIGGKYPEMGALISHNCLSRTISKISLLPAVIACFVIAIMALLSGSKSIIEEAPYKI